MWLSVNKTVGSGRRCCFAFSCGRGCILELSLILSPVNCFFLELEDGSSDADGCRLLVRRWTAFPAGLFTRSMWLSVNKTVGSDRRFVFAFICGRGCILELLDSLILSSMNFFFLLDADGCRVLGRLWTSDADSSFDAEIVSNDLR